MEQVQTARVHEQAEVSANARRAIKRKTKHQLLAGADRDRSGVADAV